MHQFTQVDTFQKVIDDIDRDLSRFGLPLTDNNSHSTLPQNNSPPMSSYNTSATHHPIIHYKCPTTPPIPPNPLSDISNLPVSPQKKANPMLTHNTTPTHYPNIPSKNTTTPPTPPNPRFDISNLKESPQNKANPITWKCIHRTGGEPTSDTIEVLGQKRPASNPTNHIGLPNKKIVVS